MTDPDAVFAKFVQANPVPDRDDIDDSDPPPIDVSDKVHDLTTMTRARQASANQRLAWAAVAAACVLAVVLTGAWLASGPTIGTDPAAPDNPDEMIRRDFVEVVQRWQAAINSGDITAALALSRPESRTVADQRVYEWLSEFAANGMPITLSDCDAQLTTPTYGRVSCRAQLGELVAIELGEADLIAPYDYEDGLVSWRSFQGGDIGLVNAAYADYLRHYHPDEYDTACNPAAYEQGTIVHDQRLALTGTCAQLAAPLAPQVVQWIREGRPNPQD